MTTKNEEIQKLIDGLTVNLTISTADVVFFDHLKLVEANLKEFSKSAVIDAEFVK